MKEFVYKWLYIINVKVKKKKILLVGHTMDRGGASHVLTILANRLSEKVGKLSWLSCVCVTHMKYQIKLI